MINCLEQNSFTPVAAHRGYSSIYPENTLLAFKEAMDYGANMIEFDLRLSNDNEIIIFHDKTVDRTTNGTGFLNDFTLSELKQLDAGSWFGPEFAGLKIPTLQELCTLLIKYPNVLLNVEIKPDIHAKKVVDLSVEILGRYGYLSRSVFTCFDAEIVSYIHDKYRLRTQGFLGQEMHNFNEDENGTYSKMWAIALSMDLLTKDQVNKFKKKGIHVWCYCPDTEEQVHYALDCGVELLTSNNLIPAMNICINTFP